MSFSPYSTFTTYYSFHLYHVIKKQGDFVSRYDQMRYSVNDWLICRCSGKLLLIIPKAEQTSEKLVSEHQAPSI